MGKRVIAPPKLYLDTNHLINIAKLRGRKALPSEKFTQAYREIDEYIGTGVCGIIFNPDTPLDWADGRATREAARQIAAVIGSAKLQTAQACRPYYFEEEQQVVQKKLTASADTGKLTVEIPPFRYHTMVVLRVENK